MAGEPTITIIGRLGFDPDARFTKEGKCFATFSIGCTPSIKQDGEYKQGETMWFKVTMWKNAEDFVETATKGTQVVVTGKLSLNSYKTKTGEDKTEYVITADGVGIVPNENKKKKDEWL